MIPHSHKNNRPKNEKTNHQPKQSKWFEPVLGWPWKGSQTDLPLWSGKPRTSALSKAICSSISSSPRLKQFTPYSSLQFMYLIKAAYASSTSSKARRNRLKQESVWAWIKRSTAHCQIMIFFFSKFSSSSSSSFICLYITTV